MNATSLTAQPHTFWQEIVAAGTYDDTPVDGFSDFYPARLPDGRQLALPLRQRNDGKEALASLIINQASFTVLDTLAGHLADMAKKDKPAVVVGVPTLGLALAQETARRLGHQRYVALSTSRKFWYEDALSVPMRSVTSPDQEKRLYLDPRMLALLKTGPIMLIDDALSTGTSIIAACRLLEKCGLHAEIIGCAMLQTDRWRQALIAQYPQLADRVHGVFHSPHLFRSEDGNYRPL